LEGAGDDGLWLLSLMSVVGLAFCLCTDTTDMDRNSRKMKIYNTVMRRL
jgi:hypothetical protein